MLCQIVSIIVSNFSQKDLLGKYRFIFIRRNAHRTTSFVETIVYKLSFPKYLETKFLVQTLLQGRVGGFLEEASTILHPT